MLGRLTGLLRRRRIDAVVTVGCGDKMFWGRLAAWLAGVPVVCSALHSTGFPDHVELPNRLLAPMTDAFIAVAASHARHLLEHEGCPAGKIRVIPNGVDVERFRPRKPTRTAPAFGHSSRRAGGRHRGGAADRRRTTRYFSRAELVRREMPNARFSWSATAPRQGQAGRSRREPVLGRVGPVRRHAERRARTVALMDVLVLTSHIEANPVSILEAMACGKPVVATAVGSVPESVQDGRTGYLTDPGDAADTARRVVELLRDRDRAAAFGRAGRQHVVAHASSQRMVEGYQDLIAGLYERKARAGASRRSRGREDCKLKNAN